MSLFSFFGNKQNALLVVHDDAIEVLQFERKDNHLKLLGHNELALNEGVVKEGQILNMEIFKQVLVNLFAQAKPNPIKVNKLYLNIPFQLLYTFVEDFAHKQHEEAMRLSVMNTIKGHFPISVDNLVLDFAFAEKNHKISAGVFASPKKWRDRLRRACKEIGVSELEFVPEPLCHSALLGEQSDADLAIFSLYKNQVYLTLFRNGLIYDSYLASHLEADTSSTCLDCHSEFRKAQKDFEVRFGVTLKNLYFLGFDKSLEKNIRENFDSKNESLNFPEVQKNSLSEFVPPDPTKITLFGLFSIVDKS